MCACVLEMRRCFACANSFKWLAQGAREEVREDQRASSAQRRQQRLCELYLKVQGKGSAESSRAGTGAGPGARTGTGQVPG